MAFTGFGNVSRPGQRNATGADIQANFPKILRDQVINDFMRECVFKDRHRVQSGEGRSVYITSRGLAEAKTRDQADINLPYTPSKRVIGNQDILIENVRYSMEAIDDWSRLQRDPQYMDDLSFDVGGALARQWDSALAINVMKGATLTTSELNSTFQTGAKVELPASTTAANVTGPLMVKEIVQLSAMYDENELDKSLNRYLTLTPTLHSNILVDKSDTVQNPLDTRVGGTGSIADGNLAKVGSVMLLPNTVLADLTVNIAAGNANWGTTGGSGKQKWNNSLVGDYSKVAAASWTPEGIATAIWQDLTVKVHTDENDAFNAVMGRGFALAKMVYGCKHLRESCCGVILYP